MGCDSGVHKGQDGNEGRISRGKSVKGEQGARGRESEREVTGGMNRIVKTTYKTPLWPELGERACGGGYSQRYVELEVPSPHIWSSLCLSSRRRSKQ